MVRFSLCWFWLAFVVWLSGVWCLLPFCGLGLVADAVDAGLGLVCCLGLVGFAGLGFCFGWLMESFGDLLVVVGYCGMRFLVVGFDLVQVFTILVSSVVFGWVLGMLCLRVGVGVVSGLVDACDLPL